MSATGQDVQQYVSSTPPRQPRATSFKDMLFQPGVITNVTGRDASGRWIGSNRVRWHKGYPEKIGGWLPQTLTANTLANGVAPTLYTGICRGACDWASLDGQQWLAFGTEQKLYLVNNGVLYDITPFRKSSNVTNVYSTVATTPIVTVADIDHEANVGDWFYLDNPVTIGGLTLQGDYQVVAVLSPNSYTFSAGANAVSTVTNGGGSFTIAYEINTGLATNGQLLGYGTDTYGYGTYGTPRPGGSGVNARMRIWSLSNWGQDLVASYNDGEIYWWQWTTGPQSRAAIIPNAPTAVQRILNNPDAEFLIAVGASDIAGNADAMNVRWCSEGILTDWIPVSLPVANTAGGQRLNHGNRMVTAINSRQQNLLWSDTQLYAMQFIGAPDYFGFTPLGSCYIVGPNALVDFNGVVYFMGHDDFYIYDGTLRVLECDLWESVYGAQDGSFAGFDRTQAEMVYCSTYLTKGEVTWFYPIAGTDLMQYITYNVDGACWYGGTMPRTCYKDVSATFTGYFETPYAFNAGTIYQHEIGYDEHEPGNVVNGMYWYLRSWDMGSQSDRGYFINSIIPNWLRLRNGFQFSYIWRENPNDAGTQVGPFIVTPTTGRYDERCGGMQIELLIEAASVAGSVVLGQDFRMGNWQLQATPHGKRISTSANQNIAINTSNP